MPGEPLPPPKVKRVLWAALASGGISFTNHALQEMAKDGITEDEALLVLRGGIVEPGEFVRQSYRYRVHASRAYVVVALRSTSAAVVVTAWRLRP